MNNRRFAVIGAIIGTTLALALKREITSVSIITAVLGILLVPLLVAYLLD